MNKSKITIEEFLLLLKYAQESHLAKNEPIPEILEVQISKVETCLETPFQAFDGASLYRTFEKKAAMLFYLLCKNHPLSNGNKRMACITLSYFCEKNNRPIIIPDSVLHWMALYTANSNDKDKALQVIEGIIKQYKKRNN